jgi:hypothetical protein
MKTIPVRMVNADASFPVEVVDCPVIEPKREWDACDEGIANLVSLWVIACGCMILVMLGCAAVAHFSH